MATRALEHPPLKINEGISTAFLLALLLISLTGSVAAVGWTDGLSMLVWPALGGLAFGILVAKLPIRGWLAHPLAILFAFAASLFFPLLLVTDPEDLRGRLVFVAVRLRDWTIKVIEGGTASDNLIFVVQLSFFAWLFAQVAAWLVFRRHQVWGAIAMIGAALLLNLFYAPPQNGLYLFLFLVSALLLVVRMNLHAMELRWRAAAIGYATDILFDFFQYGLIFSLMLLSLAWVLPDNAPGSGLVTIFDPLQGPWQSIEDQFSRVFSSLRPVERRSPGLVTGGALSIGGPIALTDRPTLAIEAKTGRYWRSATYDRYTGGGWVNNHTDAINLGVNDARLGMRPDEVRVLVTQTVQIRSVDPNNVIHVAAQPVRIDLPIEVRYSKAISEKKDFGFDSVFIRSRRPLREGDTYVAVSALSDASEGALRSVDGEYTYPAWFASAYLQLPERMPRRVQELAKTITQAQQNPYDRAIAIERFVRTRIRYSEAVSAPPTGRDAVDYMLFERPEGYCNYYASAMVVLARMAGIPARVASGYTLGEYRNGIYHLIEKDAHAWPELYFRGYGWIEFEPTANKPEIVRPRRADNGAARSDTLDEEDDLALRGPFSTDIPDGEENPYAFTVTPQTPFWAEPFNLALGGLGILLAGFAIALGARQWRRWQDVAQLAPAARVYEEMLMCARWLGVRDERTATPLERADALAHQMPSARRDIEQIAAVYTRERFGAWKPQMRERAAVEKAWVRVRAAWWKAMVERVVSYARSLPRLAQARLKEFRHRTPAPPERLRQIRTRNRSR